MVYDRKDTLRGLFPLPLLDLFAQVFRIVPRHDQVYAVDEFRLRLRILRDGLAFLTRCTSISRCISEVSIKSVGLLDQQDSARPVALEVGDHLAKLLAPGSLGCLYILECSHDLEAVTCRVSFNSFAWAPREKPSCSCSQLDTRV